MDLEIEWEIPDALKGVSLERALVKSLSRAGGDAIRGMRAAATRVIRQRKQIKAARVRAGLPLHFPVSREIAGLVWRMDVSGKTTPVVFYPARQTKRGVVAKINAGKSSLIRGAFIARMRSGHVGVFMRRGKARLPIDEAFTTRISDVFNDTGMVTSVMARGLDIFGSTFDRLMAIELGKVSGVEARGVWALER